MRPPSAANTSTKALVLLAMTVAVVALPAGAAELITIEDECNGRQLMIKGPIEAGDFQRFALALGTLVNAELPQVQDPDVLWTVKLDSPGGDLTEAMRIGRLLRQTLATTEVSYRFSRRPDGVHDFERSGELVCLNGDGRLSGCHQDIVEAECIGACLLVWLGGVERHANEGQMALHGLSGDAGDDVREYLVEMGVPGEWRSRLLASLVPGDGWLSWPERHELGGRARILDDLIANCPAPLTPEESFESVTSPSLSVRERLMDRADAHRSCRRAHLAAARAEIADKLGGAGVPTMATRG